MSFSKVEIRKVKQVLSRGWYQWKGVVYKKRVWEGKYGGDTMYSSLKMEK
jgi:hypothetical protein